MSRSVSQEHNGGRTNSSLRPGRLETKQDASRWRQCFKMYGKEANSQEPTDFALVAALVSNLIFSN